MLAEGASAAFAQWIKFFEDNYDSGRYHQTIAKAIEHIPFTATLCNVHRAPDYRDRAVLASPELRRLIVSRTPPEQLNVARQNVSLNPRRVIANQVVNFAWRDGPIEDVHADVVAGTPRRYQSIVREAASRLAVGMDICFLLCQPDSSRESWVERALPFRLDLFYPSGWTLDEDSRPLHLRG
jgi:hypothetical protein